MCAQVTFLFLKFRNLSLTFKERAAINDLDFELDSGLCSGLVSELCSGLDSRHYSEIYLGLDLGHGSGLHLAPKSEIY